jgi:homing endonuclease-like protein
VVYENILRSLQNKQLVLPYLENQVMADKWPDSYDVHVDSRPYYGLTPDGRPDGYFHPSTHPLRGARELYYEFHPDHRHNMIGEQRTMQSHMTLAMGSALHAVLQAQMLMIKRVEEKDIEVEYIIEDHHVRGRIDWIFQHPTEGPLIVEMKALATDTPIATPTGWSTMGDLKEGDEVFAPDGQPTKVTNVSPIYLDRPCYRMTFKDGQSIVADADHRWMVRDFCRQTDRVMTTQELVDANLRSGNNYRFSVPVPEALQCPEVELPIDPWLLGMWLGDGDSNNAVITCGKDDLSYLCDRLDALGYEYQAGSYAPRPNVFSVYVYGLRAPLIALGLLGNKHIPERYMKASEHQRRQLLAGLMDSDGTIGEHQVSICMVKEPLMRKVLQLVRSLGYRATWKTSNHASQGIVHWVKFSSRWVQPPFDMPRKRIKFEQQAACGSKVNLRINAITSIEPTESVPVRCITVAHESSLYLAGEGFVTTHNTRTGYKFDKTTIEDMPSWDAQLSLAEWSQGHDRGILLMAESAWPYRLRELPHTRNDKLLEEIFYKFDYVREAIAANDPPRHCCAFDSPQMTSCPARHECWLKGM